MKRRDHWVIPCERRGMEFLLDENVEMVAPVKERWSISICGGCVWMAPPALLILQLPHMAVVGDCVQLLLTSGSTASIQLIAGLVHPS